MNRIKQNKSISAKKRYRRLFFLLNWKAHAKIQALLKEKTFTRKSHMSVLYQAIKLLTITLQLVCSLKHSIINLNIKLLKMATVLVKRSIIYNTRVKMALNTLHGSVLSDWSGHCHTSNSRWNLLIPLILRCLGSYHGNRSGLRWWHLALHNSSWLNCSHW